MTGPSPQAQAILADVRSGKLELAVICELYVRYRTKVDEYERAYVELEKLATRMGMMIGGLNFEGRERGYEDHHRGEPRRYGPGAR